MPAPALMVPLLVMAAQAGAPSGESITVTGSVPWAPFISPMGEPFHPHSADEDTLATWFRQADHNRDGELTPDEMQADADHFFARLDSNHDGLIDPEELIQYEWEIAPEIQVNSKLKRSRGEVAARPITERRRNEGDEFEMKPPPGRRLFEVDRGPQGAARYALLNIPEPVAAADADFDRAITLAEFRRAAVQRFQLLDTARQGRIALVQLQALAPRPGVKVKHREDEPDARVGLPLPPEN